MNKTQGRRICDVLKEIRNKISKEGNLELNQKECHYKGECSGTCPACEAELKKINETFNHKKLVAMAGCATMVLPMTGCTNNKAPLDDVQGLMEYREELEGDIEIKEDVLTSNPEDSIIDKNKSKEDLDNCEITSGEELDESELLQGDIEYIEDENNENTTPEDIDENIDTIDLIPTAGVLPPENYVFTEDEDDFPKGITTLEDLKVSEKMKDLIKKDFPQNHLRGVINPNAM